MKKLTKSLFLVLLTGGLLLTGCGSETAGETEAQETESIAETEAVPEEVFVTYEEFGAKGDGVNDDFAALIAAHAYANENDLKVKAKDDAVYYLGASLEPIVIQTSTDWGNAKFIIDDRNLEDINVNVFRVTSKLPAYKIELSTLAKNQENLGMTLEQDALVYVENKNVTRFKRTTWEGRGHAQQDIFVVSKDGTIDPNTPIVWDYEEITNATVYPIPEDTLYLTGGVFTTLSGDVDFDAYVRRSLTVIRSNTVIEGLTHYIEEGAIGVPHYGFLIFEDCANITVKDTNITARADGSGKYVSNYEMNLTRVANGTFINLIQMNEFSKYSTMGSNYCKNLVFDGCRLNRIDAHAGITNLTVRNCDSRINVGGFGTLLVENTTSHGDHFITFRSDYGGTWDGDVIIRNCTWIPEGTTGPLEIMDGSNPEHWDFGYECYLTRTLTIDGLHIHNSEENPTVYVFINPAPYYYDKATYRVYKYSIQYPYTMPEKVEVSGVTYEYTAADGTEQLAISPNTYIFEIGKTEFYIDGVQQEMK